jgi:hypothetical protein
MEAACPTGIGYYTNGWCLFVLCGGNLVLAALGVGIIVPSVPSGDIKP